MRAVDPELVTMAAQWRAMNILRVMLFVAVKCALLAPVYRASRMLCASRLENT